MTFPQWYTQAAQLGFPFVLATALYLLWQGVLRWGREFKELKAIYEAHLAELTNDRDEWKARALHFIDLTDQVTTLAKVVADIAKRVLP